MLSQRDAVKTEMAKSTLASTGKYSFFLFLNALLIVLFVLFSFEVATLSGSHRDICMLKKLALFCSQGEKSGEKKVIAYIIF